MKRHLFLACLPILLKAELGCDSERVWEDLVRGKGGREALRSVDSQAVQWRQVSRGNRSKHQIADLWVLPDLHWWWADLGDKRLGTMAGTFDARAQTARISSSGIARVESEGYPGWPLFEKLVLKSMPAIVLHCFGIFFDGKCGGAVVYGNEYAENLGVWDRYGYSGKIICLARGACTHWAHPHSASKLIRSSMRMLPDKYKVVTATVDSSAGEVGTIYQAAGFDFVGQMSSGGSRPSIMTPEGKRISEREAYRQYGTRSVEALAKMGLDVRSVPRKSRYFGFLGSKREQRENRQRIEHLIKPYPKRPPQRENATQVHPEFRALIGPLSKEEREQLEANLLAEGCRDPLVVWKGILLDGHNRLEICERLQIPFKTVELDLESQDAAKLWIEENQIGRRNLTTDQRAAIAYRMMQRRVALSKQERARKGGSARALHLVAPPTTEQPSPSTRQRELAATQLGVSPNRLKLVSGIAKATPEAVEQLVAGTLTIKQAQEQIAERERRRLRREAAKAKSDESHIHVGDLSTFSNLVKDGSVDLVLTDPTNGMEGRPLFSALARVAQRKLKPGGLCAVLCGQLHFDEAFTAMGKHLDYYWIAGITGEGKGKAARILSRRMVNALKLVVIFAKRPFNQTRASSLPFLKDVIDSDRDPVQQLIEHLSRPGELVVDPFVGDGAVPVACSASKRRFVGTEFDPGVAQVARARLATVKKLQAARR